MEPFAGPAKCQRLFSEKYTYFHIRNKSRTIVLYAGDILLIARSVSELQELFDACVIGWT